MTRRLYVWALHLPCGLHLPRIYPSIHLSLSLSLSICAFVGRVEGERALHLSLGGVHVIARRARHLAAMAGRVDGCNGLLRGQLCRQRHTCTSRSIMPPLSTFHSPLNLSLALADSWKHSDLPAGTVKPKDAAWPTRQPAKSQHLCTNIAEIDPT